MAALQAISLTPTSALPLSPSRPSPRIRPEKSPRVPQTFLLSSRHVRSPCPPPSGRRRLVPRRVSRADRGAGEAWPAIKAGRNVLIAAPTGSGKTLAAFLAAIDGLVRQGVAGDAAGRDADRLRLAAEGAVERHPQEPRGAARRHSPRPCARRPAGSRDPHLGAHRRHAAGRARPRDPPAAAHRRDDAGIALHPARLGIRPEDAGDDAHRHRRRDPRGGAEQARRASRAVAGAPRRALRRQAAAHRPVGDAEADRGGRALPRRRRRGGREAADLHDHRHRPSPRPRPRPRDSRRRRSKR